MLKPINSKAAGQAAGHAAKVGAYIVGSGVLALGVSFLADNPNYLALAPIINLAAAWLIKYSQIAKK